jgi:hypothetical protein
MHYLQFHLLGFVSDFPYQLLPLWSTSVVLSYAFFSIRRFLICDSTHLVEAHHLWCPPSRGPTEVTISMWSCIHQDIPYMRHFPFVGSAPRLCCPPSRGPNEVVMWTCLHATVPIWWRPLVSVVLHLEVLLKWLCGLVSMRQFPFGGGASSVLSPSRGLTAVVMWTCLHATVPIWWRPLVCVVSI